MDMENRIKNFENEVAIIKREGARISDDTRKAIIHDISEKSKNSRYKALTIGVAFITVIVYLITYIGFTSVKSSFGEYIVKSEVKKQIISEISKEREESTQILNDAKLLVSQLKLEKNNLNQQIAELLAKVNIEQQRLVKVSNLIAKLNVANKDIESIIDPALLKVIQQSNLFIFIKSFGISDLSVIKFLASETEGFNFNDITKETISDNVRQIQERYRLTVDGNLGPCSSLVVGSLILENHELETRNELGNSSYSSDKWLTNSFQTCSKKDKTQLQRYLDFSDLPLHSQLNTFITSTGMQRSILISNLTKNMPTPNAYKALDYIGYQQP
jgi:hypothetical protein